MNSMPNQIQKHSVSWNSQRSYSMSWSWRTSMNLSYPMRSLNWIELRSSVLRRTQHSMRSRPTS